MRRLAMALVVAGTLAGAVMTVQAKSLYVINHWNESTKQWSQIKTDVAGCLNHIQNHPEDYIVYGADQYCNEE